MKVKTLQIVWHAKEAVYSLDFHPSGVLATGGGDNDVKVETGSDGFPCAVHTANLSAHNGAVNCVRFSPSGAQLATAGDGGEFYLWRSAAEGAPIADWRAFPQLRGHGGDVFDVAWAADGSALVSGSIENQCIVWDADSGKGRVRFDDHRHYVTGLAWDPAAQLIVSQSSDKTCRVYGMKPPAAGKKAEPGNAVERTRDFVCQHVVSKRLLPTQPQGWPGSQRLLRAMPPWTYATYYEVAKKLCGTGGGATSGGGGKKGTAWQHLFWDDTLGHMFRRLAWSPEGSMLVAVAGAFQPELSKPMVHAAHVFARGCWTAPALVLPLPKAAVAVAFCPILFAPHVVTVPGPQLKVPGPAAAAFAALPYRLVFAVATSDSVVLYDTGCGGPVCLLGGLHLAQVTDLAWSCDGRLLAVASFDGYCSVADFSAGELGRPLPEAEIAPHLQPLMRAARKGAPAPSMLAATPPLAQHAAAPAANGPTPPQPGAMPLTPLVALPHASQGLHAPSPTAVKRACEVAHQAAGGPRLLKRLRHLGCMAMPGRPAHEAASAEPVSATASQDPSPADATPAVHGGGKLCPSSKGNLPSAGTGGQIAPPDAAAPRRIVPTPQSEGPY